MRRRREIRDSKVIRVTVIVAGLLALLFAFGEIPIDLHTHQKKVRSQTNATGLFQAIEGFVDVYGGLPSEVPKGGELVMEGKECVEFLTVLLGKEKLNQATQNKKQIRFLNTEETKMKDRGGLLYGKGGGRADAEAVAGPTGVPEGLYDSWGRPFRVRFAADERLEIADPFKAGEVVKGKRAIVFSYGKNGKAGDKDDVKTW